jgi:hypothetical protein
MPLRALLLSPLGGGRGVGNQIGNRFPRTAQQITPRLWTWQSRKAQSLSSRRREYISSSGHTAAAPAKYHLTVLEAAAPFRPVAPHDGPVSPKVGTGDFALAVGHRCIAISRVAGSHSPACREWSQSPAAIGTGDWDLALIMESAIRINSVREAEYVSAVRD